MTSMDELEETIAALHSFHDRYATMLLTEGTASSYWDWERASKGSYVIDIQDAYNARCNATLSPVFVTSSLCSAPLHGREPAPLYAPVMFITTKDHLIVLSIILLLNAVNLVLILDGLRARRQALSVRLICKWTWNTMLAFLVESILLILYILDFWGKVAPIDNSKLLSSRYGNSSIIVTRSYTPNGCQRHCLSYLYHFVLE